MGLQLCGTEMFVVIRLFPSILKGRVHPKMKMLSLFTHLQVLPICMRYFLLLNTNESILKTVGNQTVDVLILKKNTMEVNGVPTTLWLPTYYYFLIFIFR